MHETHTTQVQFPSPGQRRRLAVAAITATQVVAAMAALGRGTHEHRSTPRVYLREATETPVVVIDTEMPETVSSEWELQAAIDEFCVSYRSLFDLDPATGERPLPRGCTGAVGSTGREASVDLEFGIDIVLADASR
jgi:hypothetical protein